MKYTELARVLERVSAARNEPQRIAVLSEFFSRLNSKSLPAAAHLVVGELVPPTLGDKIGVGPGTIRNVLAELSRKSADEIDKRVKDTGDLSEAATVLPRGRDTLEIDELWKMINLALKKDIDRSELLRRIFSKTSAIGARYIIRSLINEMRIGAGFGTVMKSLASAFGVNSSLVERVYTLTNDIGYVAAQSRKGGRVLAKTGVKLFTPYQFMNAERVEQADDIFETLRGKQIIFEVKYDGARLQIHISGKGHETKVKLYSRRLNDDTAAMPDVVAAVRKAWKGGDAIVEGEVVAFDSTLSKKLPFQSVLMRLGRVHNIRETALEIPLRLFIFDILYNDGQDLMALPQSERRVLLKKKFRSTDRLSTTSELVTNQIGQALSFFKRAIKDGQEGLMAKDPDALYIPGRRTSNWMKLKPAFETLDVVVVGGIWGSGRRKGTLSSLIIAVRSKDEFVTVGKVGAGFSEQMLGDLTAKLAPKIISTRGRNVEIEPSMVLEVDFQDIQKTTAYSSGYALRIPRFKRERLDKGVREADTLDRLVKLYKQSH